MSDENWAHAMRRHDPPKKSGKTPEAKVTAECDRYLKLIGALVIRANAGAWKDDEGHTIQGAKAGTSDKIVCLNGRFIALELKAAKGKQSDAQRGHMGLERARRPVHPGAQQRRAARRAGGGIRRADDR